MIKDIPVSLVSVKRRIFIYKACAYTLKILLEGFRSSPRSRGLHNSNHPCGLICVWLCILMCPMCSCGLGDIDAT